MMFDDDVVLLFVRSIRIEKILVYGDLELVGHLQRCGRFERYGGRPAARFIVWTASARFLIVNEIRKRCGRRCGSMPFFASRFSSGPVFSDVLVKPILYPGLLR